MTLWTLRPPAPTRRVRLLGARLLAPFLLAPAAAADARPITMPEVIALRGANPGDLSLDRDGVLGTVDGGPGRRDQVLGVRQMVRWRDGVAAPLGAGVAPARSPDGRWMIYAQDHAWVLKDERTGAVRSFDAGRPITAFSGPPAWSADSRYVAATYDLRGESAYRADPPTTVAPGVRVIVHDQRDGSPAPPTLVYHPQLLLWAMDRAQPQIRATPGQGALPGSWRTTAAAHQYYYAATQTGGVGLKAYTTIKAVEAETGAETDLYSLANASQGLKPQVSPDGRLLAFVADPSTPNYGVSGRVLVMDLADRTVRSIAPTAPAVSLQWGKDGRIYFLAQEGGLPQLCSVSLQGDIRQLTHDAVARRDLAISAGREDLVYATADGYGRTELRAWRVGGHHEQRLATLAAPDADVTLGRFEPMRWTTPDGVSLHGFLVYPPSFDPARRYPLLVDVHGGGPGNPLALGGLFGLRSRTPLDWQAWAALGYVVFAPDFRSSGEYGVAINTKIARAAEDLTGVRGDADDLDSGVRAVLARPYVDAGRVAAIGHSAGGPRLASLLTRTHLFAAAILDDPSPFGPDAVTLSAVKYGGPAYWTRAKLPSERQEVLGDDVLLDGWKVTTPTLIMVGDQSHGALDPLSAETLYAMMLSQGAPTRFIHYVDDGHIPLSDATATDHYREMRDWLARYAPPG